MEGVVVSESLHTLFGGAYAGKRVLVTGHTGFKGSWLSVMLTEMGAEVFGLALAPYTERDLFVSAGVERLLAGHAICDVRDIHGVTAAVHVARPDIVFHLAAQPLVRYSYECPAETYDVNVVGTANVLDSVRLHAAFAPTVVITSDKCYRNDERLDPYAEDAPLGGHDPYSSSKACQELLSAAYRDSYWVPEGRAWALKTVRAGNVIGGGDWAADRIIPDAVKALLACEDIGVRNPASVRPWQHVLEPLGGYLALGARMLSGAESLSGAYNFGPSPESHLTVGELMDEFVDVWGSGAWRHTPQPGAVHEASLLALDATRAQRELGWAPVLGARDAVRMSAEWYRAQASGVDMLGVTREQIDRYAADATAVWRLTGEGA